VCYFISITIPTLQERESQFMHDAMININFPFRAPLIFLASAEQRSCWLFSSPCRHFNFRDSNGLSVRAEVAGKLNRVSGVFF
jgi:hypothetical protein